MVPEQSTPCADRAAIQRDLEYMTARWGELGRKAWIEIRAFRPDRQPQIAKFLPEDIPEAVDFAANMNGMGYNVYAVRNPIRYDIGGGSASDTDIIAAFFLWADCDDPASAGNVYRFDGPKWSAAVTTGRTPSIRVHTYWQLQEPCTDMDAWRAMQSAIAVHFGSDRSVINPSRIMRIGGTVAYPDPKKQARGYVNELTAIKTVYEDDRPLVTMEQMGRIFLASPPAQLPLSQRAAATAPNGTSFQIDAGGYAPSLDREQMAIQALSGMEWHNAVIRLVGSYVARGLSDNEIHALTDPLTLAGYTVEQTRREVQTAIDGARRKGWTPEAQYADPSAIRAPDLPEQTPAREPSFDAPKRKPELEWFDDVAPVLSSGYLVKGLLDAGAMSVIYGPSNSGKTFFALDLVYHIAIGATWRGRRVKQAAVLYLAAEGGKGVINRVAALKQAHGVCDVALAVKRAGLDLLHDQADLQHIVDLAAIVQDSRPGMPLVIVIDTLSRIMAGGDENSAADMTALIRNIDAIREATKAHVILVHHTGKDTARGARGHSSLRAATDTEIEVANESGSRAALVTKQRDHQGGETFPFAIKPVQLGFDDDGDEVSSCVVEAQDEAEFAAAQKRTKGIGGVQKLLLDTFNQMIADDLANGTARSNPGGYSMPDPGTFWVVDKAEFRRVCMGKIAAADPKSSFNKALNALTTERRLFGTGENLVWCIEKRVSK